MANKTLEEEVKDLKIQLAKYQKQLDTKNERINMIINNFNTRVDKLIRLNDYRHDLIREEITILEQQIENLKSGLDKIHIRVRELEVPND